MFRLIRTPFPAVRGLKTGLITALRLTPALVAAAGLAACQPTQSSGRLVEDLLFSPTFTKNRQDIPYTYNTPYDCRSFTGSGWKGIASGVVHNFGQKYQLSQAGCFRTQQECQAYLAVMRGYIDIPYFIRCNPYSA
ncbi:hypothetical protein [Roseibium sp.]|uniref:hypothetical protein n=1 Tax=Roseibium sp. TaxID=1936156 RepID=UPI003D14292C